MVCLVNAHFIQLATWLPLLHFVLTGFLFRFLFSKSELIGYPSGVKVNKLWSYDFLQSPASCSPSALTKPWVKTSLSQRLLISPRPSLRIRNSTGSKRPQGIRSVPRSLHTSYTWSLHMYSFRNTALLVLSIQQVWIKIHPWPSDEASLAARMTFFWPFLVRYHSARLSFKRSFSPNCCVSCRQTSPEP